MQNPKCWPNLGKKYDEERTYTNAASPQGSTSAATPPYGFSDEIQPVPQPPMLEDFDVAKGDLAPIGGETGNR